MSILTNDRIGRLLKPVRRVSQLRRTRGNGRTAYAAILRVAAWPLVRNCLHLCAVDYWRLPLTGTANAHRPSSLFTVRRAEPADTAMLAEYFGDHQRVARRFAHGDRCILAVSQNTIGAAAWLSTGPGQFQEDWDELRCVFRFPTGFVWSFDGKGTKLGAWGTLMRQLPAMLRADGVQEVATIVDCNNWQSIDGHRSLGYVAAGVVLYVRLFGFSRHFFKPLKGRWQHLPSAINGVTIDTKRPSI